MSATANVPSLLESFFTDRLLRQRQPKRLRSRERRATLSGIRHAPQHALDERRNRRVR